MDAVSVDEKKTELSIDNNELLILYSALNEVCNGISVPEFETRIGASKEAAFTLLNDLGRILDKVRL
ncbi:hypothetical protein GW590_00905 [Rahnella sp. SAP-1]|uniref:Uncharacterized protein n=1 Tax=Rouxiella aceris TaxID=2703884 RepID=A0A848MBH3_9GAMM|nr:hypothetical protein [Rouxiella aceris]NMP25447.1 hypothetical protein [Rouxiella aceris]